MLRHTLLVVLVIALVLVAGRRNGEALPTGSPRMAGSAATDARSPERREARVATRALPHSLSTRPREGSALALARAVPGGTTPQAEGALAARPASEGGTRSGATSRPGKASGDASTFEEKRSEARRFLAGLYRNFRGREGDADAIAIWADLIAAGTFTREQAIEHFLDSAETLQVATPLARLYFAAFGRAPDEPGWRHWQGVLASGQSLEAIGEAFTSGPEFAATYGALGDGQFVELVHRNVLGRDPTPAERAQWESQLSSGLSTRGGVLLALTESPSFTASLADEVSASMLYSGLLGRSADAEGFAAWMRTAQREGFTRNTMIAGFLDSGEYRARSAAPLIPGR